MTPVRTRRGKVVHLTHDLQVTLCGKTLQGYIVEPRAEPLCRACIRAAGR
jgi:hypothetical protein